MEPGDEVTIAYTGYTIDATVLEPPTRSGWVLVEQITDFEDRKPGDRPRFEAAVEFVVPRGETPPPGPFEAILRSLNR